MNTRADLFSRLQAEGAYWGTGVTFKRTNPVPIDMTSVFKSLTEAQTYAMDANNVAYPGQTVAVISDSNEVTLYIVQPKVEGMTAEQSLVEVGKTTLGDGVSVEVENDRIKLKNFGKEYYAYNADAEEGADPYVLTQGWKAGLEPRVKLDEGGSFSLAWYEPSSTTVEGVSKIVGELSQTVTTMSGNLSAAQNDIRNLQTADTTMDGRVTTVEGKVGTLEGTVNEHTATLAEINGKFDDYSTTVEVESKINTAIAGLTHFDKKVVTADTREAAMAQMTDANTLYLYKATEEADAYEEYILIDTVPTMIGDTSTDLQDYAKTVEVTTAITNATKDLVSNNLLQAEIAEVEDKFENYNTKEEVSKAIESATNDMATITYVNGQLEGITTDIGTLDDTVKSHTTTIGEHTTKLAQIESDLGGKATQADLATANGKIEVLQGDVETINSRIDSLGNTYATDAELDARAGAIEGEVAKKADAEQVAEDIEAAKNAAITTAGTNSEAAIAGALSKYTDTEGLTALLANKVSTQSSEYKGEQVAWTLLSPENQAKLAALVIGDNGVEISGKVNASNVEELGAWITTNRDSVTGLFSTSLAADLDTAKTQAAESISAIELGGVNVTVEGRKAKIGVAGSTLGVVKSTDADNGVSVAADGTMSVNSIKTSKLVDDTTTPLILFGGNA